MDPTARLRTRSSLGSPTATTGTKEGKKKRKTSASISEEPSSQESQLDILNSSMESVKKRKKKGAPASTTPMVTAMLNNMQEIEDLAAENATAAQQVGKKKKKKKREELDVVEEVTLSPRTDDDTKKKKKKATPAADVTIVSPRHENGVGKVSAAEEDGKKRRKKKAKWAEGEEIQVESSSPAKEQSFSKTLPARRESGVSSEVASPSKKAKVTQEDVKEEEEEVEWSQEEELALVERLKEQLPKKDKKSFRVTLKTVDWERAALEGRSGQECRDYFNVLLAKISTIKTLTSVVDDVKQLVESGRRGKRVLNPLARFMKDYLTEKRKMSFKKKELNCFVMAHKAWRELPEDKRQHYQQEFKQDLGDQKRRVQRTVKERLPVKSPRQPHQVFGDGFNETVPARTLKHDFTALPPEKKLSYIHTSLQEFMAFERNLDEYCKENPSYQRPQSLPSIARTDLKMYLEWHRMPLPPPATVKSFYLQELCRTGQLDGVEGKDRLAEAAARYKACDALTKDSYKRKLKKRMDRYEPELDAWAREQDAVTLYAKDVYNKPLLPKSGKQAERKAREALLAFSNTQPALMTCPRFHEQPERPPRTGYDLFRFRSKKTIDADTTSPAKRRQAFREKWDRLAPEAQQEYGRRCDGLRATYHDELLQYVHNMEKKVRRVFLGFNRVKICKFFGWDVFEQEYPNERYPVYVRPAKKATPTPGIKRPASPSLSSDHKLFQISSESSDSSDETALHPAQVQRGVVNSSSEDEVAPSPRKVIQPPQPLRGRHSGPKRSYSSDDDDSDDEDTFIEPPWRSLGQPAPSTLAAPPRKNMTSSDDSDSDASDSD